ncbi:hypothetical protein J2Z76_000434 [Sedimentibacter acidaminivorans]|uniref:Uncharacterized protein n=1 Tax=Sedimentibacter acidaminivorans TaxID=913099 RepID=A0ABS4GA65_9FIRM|nr:hypothetical protein [Sedimentibacter acidaminivorans]MBP1924581.1 hypothetical protein [Sedimentibacter acidaminivorans]
MRKAINIEVSNNNVVRVLSIADEAVIENNPTCLSYFIIEDYVEPPTLNNPLSVNYPMYDKINKVFMWIRIQYQNTVTDELLQIENLKVANQLLQTELNTTKEELVLANVNINMLIELQADMLRGAI